MLTRFSPRVLPHGFVALLLATALTLPSCREHSAAPVASADSLPDPPSFLLTYRNDSANTIDGGGIYPTDSEQVYGKVNSYPLLHAVILDPRADPRVFPFAIEQALLLVGPNKVFGDVRLDARRNPELFREGPRSELLQRAAHTHVWVSASAFIDEKDLPLNQARKILEQIIAQIRSGASFDAAYMQARSEHAHPDLATHDLIGNLGNWVLSNDKPNAEPFRLPSELPPSHIHALLRANDGDLLILEDDNPEDRRLILYQVREVYHPI